VTILWVMVLIQAFSLGYKLGEDRGFDECFNEELELCCSEGSEK